MLVRRGEWQLILQNSDSWLELNFDTVNLSACFVLFIFRFADRPCSSTINCPCWKEPKKISEISCVFALAWPQPATRGSNQPVVSQCLVMTCRMWCRTRVHQSLKKNNKKLHRVRCEVLYIYIALCKIIVIFEWQKKKKERNDKMWQELCNTTSASQNSVLTWTETSFH